MVRPMTEDQRLKTIQLFLAMYSANKPPDPETPFILADFYEFEPTEVDQCMQIALTQHLQKGE